MIWQILKLLDLSSLVYYDCYMLLWMHLLPRCAAMLCIILAVGADSPLIFYPGKVIGAEKSNRYGSPPGCLIAARNPRIIGVKHLSWPPVRKISFAKGEHLLEEHVSSLKEEYHRFWNCQSCGLVRWTQLTVEALLTSVLPPGKRTSFSAIQCLDEGE